MVATRVIVRPYHSLELHTQNLPASIPYKELTPSRSLYSPQK